MHWGGLTVHYSPGNEMRWSSADMQDGAHPVLGSSLNAFSCKWLVGRGPAFLLHSLDSITASPWLQLVSDKPTTVPSAALLLAFQGSEGLISGLSLSYTRGFPMCFQMCRFSGNLVIRQWCSTICLYETSQKNGRTDTQDLPALLVCAGNNGARGNHRKLFFLELPSGPEWMAWSLGNGPKLPFNNS